MKKEKVEKFLEEIEKVCRKHNMSISHEDGHGAFIIEKFDEFNISWLKGASIVEYKD
ncbi:hypothetical protein MAWWA_93 [Bacillus phage vB_BspH_Mawwa]|nr:hypothetical protein MAWWA_93 [Bacillus phage vB_BspH_Mawwa]